MTCQHGTGVILSGPNAVVDIGNDVSIIEQVALGKRSGGAPAKKKAEKRIMKSLSRISKDSAEAKRILMAELHGMATQKLLIGEFRKAKSFCDLAITVQQLHCDGKAASYSHNPSLYLPTVMEISTDQGVLLYLAKRIPCNCLKKLRKETKKQTKMGYCFQCRKQAPVTDQFMCGGCNTITYCSPDCQKLHWPSHKHECRHVSKQKSNRR